MRTVYRHRQGFTQVVEYHPENTQERAALEAAYPHCFPCECVCALVTQPLPMASIKGNTTR